MSDEERIKKVQAESLEIMHKENVGRAWAHGRVCGLAHGWALLAAVSTGRFAGWREHLCFVVAIVLFVLAFWWDRKFDPRRARQ